MYGSCRSGGQRRPTRAASALAPIRSGSGKWAMSVEARSAPTPATSKRKRRETARGRESGPEMTKQRSSRAPFSLSSSGRRSPSLPSSSADAAFRSCSGRRGPFLLSSSGRRSRTRAPITRGRCEGVNEASTIAGQHCLRRGPCDRGNPSRRTGPSRARIPMIAWIRQVPSVEVEGWNRVNSRVPSHTPVRSDLAPSRPARDWREGCANPGVETFNEVDHW